MWIGKRYCFEQYSDSVAALFSGLAFVILIISIQKQTQAIKLQRKEFKQQLKEYKNSLEEQKKANEEFRKQNKHLELQKFENSFFHLLQNIFTISQSLIPDEEYAKEKSEPFFNVYLDRIQNGYLTDLFRQEKEEEFRLQSTPTKKRILERSFYLIDIPRFRFKTNIYFRSILYANQFLKDNKQLLDQDSYNRKSTLLRFHIHDSAVYLITLIYLFRDEPTEEFKDLIIDLDLIRYFRTNDPEINSLILDLLNTKLSSENEKGK